jgi:hypothetical protein
MPKKPNQEVGAESGGLVTENSQSTKDVAAAKPEATKKMAVVEASQRLDQSVSVKSEVVDSVKKVKSLPAPETPVDSNGNTVSALQPRRVAPAATVSPPVRVAADSSPSPSTGRRSSAAAALPGLVTRKSGSLQEGNADKRQASQPPKAQEKAGAGEAKKGHKSLKSPASEGKKSVNSSLSKTAHRTGSLSKCSSSKSVATAVGKSSKSLTFTKSSPSKSGSKAVTGSPAVQPLTVNLRTLVRAKKDIKDRAICMVCDIGSRRNEKLIFCKNCDKIGKFCPFVQVPV